MVGPSRSRGTVRGASATLLQCLIAGASSGAPDALHCQQPFLCGVEAQSSNADEIHLGRLQRAPCSAANVVVCRAKDANRKSSSHRSRSKSWSSSSSDDSVKHGKKRRASSMGLDDLMAASDSFSIPFPVQTVRCNDLLVRKYNEKKLLKHINSAYPMVHEESLKLMKQFLDFEQSKGKNASFYKGMSLVDFITRLLTKRAASCFGGATEKYLLVNGTNGEGGWEKVGTSKQCPPLLLKDVLTLDEIRLSSLISISSKSFFINSGERLNRGIPVKGKHPPIETEGIVVGAVGPRLEAPGRNEFLDLIITPEQNTAEHGFGAALSNSKEQLFAKFYSQTDKLFDKQKLNEQPKRFLAIDGAVTGSSYRQAYFDKVAYSKRLRVILAPIFVEANERAAKSNQKAFVHIVGFGLGVWRACPEQNELFIEAIRQTLKELNLPHVSDVYIAHLVEDPKQLRRLEGQKVNNVTLHFGNRNPQDKLQGADAGKLLVVTYATDGNALPGNLFWLGCLGGTGDPANACCTQVAELHNPHINRNVCARNLRVVTHKGQLVSLSEFLAQQK